MTVTVVLDGAGLGAWARTRPPPQVVTVMEVLRRHGSGRVVVPSVVTVEALTGRAGGPVDLALAAIEVESALPIEHARAAARLREGLRVSAADAVVAESVLRNRAQFVVTSDPDDLRALLRRGGGASVIVTV